MFCVYAVPKKRDVRTRRNFAPTVQAALTPATHMIAAVAATTHVSFRRRRSVAQVSVSSNCVVLSRVLCLVYCWCVFLIFSRDGDNVVQHVPLNRRLCRVYVCVNI